MFFSWRWGYEKNFWEYFGADFSDSIACDAFFERFVAQNYYDSNTFSANISGLHVDDQWKWRKRSVFYERNASDPNSGPDLG